MGEILNLVSKPGGLIDQDADLIMFLYRDSNKASETGKTLAETEIIIAKQRNGQPGTVRLNFSQETGRFESVASGDKY